MDAEIRRIKRLNHEKFISGPTLPSEEFMLNALVELNRNLSGLRYNKAKSTDSKVYVNYLKKNIYIILVIFNKMMVSPTYFFNSILNLVSNRTCGKDEISIDEIIEIAREYLKNNNNGKNIENYLLERITSVVDSKKKKSIKEIHDIAVSLSKQKKYNPAMDDIVGYLSEIIKPDEFTTLENVCSLVSQYKSNDNENEDQNKREFERILVASSALSGDYNKITIFEIKQAFAECERESEFAQISKDILDLVIEKLADKEVTLQDIHNTINILMRDEIPNAIRIGLDEKKYRIPKGYTNNDIESAYNRVVKVLEKLGIFYDVDLNEVSQSLDEIILYHNAIADDIINYRLVYTYVEDLTRLLFEYLTLLAMVGENPKNDLNKYIIYKSKISHPFVNTLKTVKKMNFTEKKNKFYHHVMLVVTVISWLLKIIAIELPYINMPISMEVIDIAAAFSSIETVLTLVDDRARGILATVASIVASPFILTSNIVKGMKRAKRLEKNREQEIRQAKKELAEIEEYQKERKSIKKLALENIKFMDEQSNDGNAIIADNPIPTDNSNNTVDNSTITTDNSDNAVADNKKDANDIYIPAVIAMIDQIKIRINFISDNETRIQYINKLNTKIDKLNEYLRDNSEETTREMFYLYAKDQLSVLDGKIRETISKENGERLAQTRNNIDPSYMMKSLELEKVNFSHIKYTATKSENGKYVIKSNDNRTTAEINEDNVILFKAVLRVEKVKSRIRSIEDYETRMSFVSRMNQKLDNMNWYLITTSGTLTVAKMYAYVKSQLSVINEQVKEVLREEEEVREQARLRNNVKIKI